MIAPVTVDPRAVAALFGDPVPPARRMQPLDAAAVWQLLGQVLDPEVPVLSVVELGIVREVHVVADGTVAVVVTPTYIGCPATEAIAAAIVSALMAAGAPRVRVEQRYSPAWSTDWLGDAARDKLRRYGIAPPAHWVGADTPAADDAAGGPSRPLRFHPRGIACPRCGSPRTEQLSAFGATACKALYRCTACREPFEYFKPV